MADAPEPYRPNSLDDIGAAVVAIRSLTENSGGLGEEETRAVFQLACLATVAWRILDVEAANAPARTGANR